MSAENSSLPRLDAFLDDRRQLTREQFLAKHTYPVLVLTLTPEGGVVEDGGEFRTQAVVMGQPLIPPAPSPKLTAIVPILKRMKDPFPTFIWVGRESRCDVTLPFSSVSKLQAQFLKKPNGDWDILDAGSTNGTFLNGVQLAKNKPVGLHDLAQLRFGKIDTRFRTTVGFWDELGKYL